MTESLRCYDSFLCWLVVGSVFFSLCVSSFLLFLSLYNKSKLCIFSATIPPNCWLFANRFPVFSSDILLHKTHAIEMQGATTLRSNWVAWVLNTLYSIYAYKISKTIDILYHIFWRPSFCISLTVFMNLILIAGSKRISVLLRFKDRSEISQWTDPALVKCQDQISTGQF